MNESVINTPSCFQIWQVDRYIHREAAMNNLPLRYLSKINTYNNISINGVDVKATVLDGGGSEEFINSCMTEIRMSLVRDLPVVGIDIIKNKLRLVKSLLIFVENRCLIILLQGMPSLPSAVSSFLTDDSICFVGFQIGKLVYRHVVSTSKSNDGYFWLISDTSAIDCLTRRLIGKQCPVIIKPNENQKVCLRTVPIGEFAARVVKDSTLKDCSSLVELAGKTGIDVKHVPCQNKEVDWGAVCFSQEEIKSIVQDVYLCYKIAMRALSTL